MDTNTIDVENVQEVLCDGERLFLFLKRTDHYEVQCLNAGLEEISSFRVQYYHNPYLPCAVDSDSIYAPTTDGLILSLDKFAGSLDFEIDLKKSLLVSDIVVDADRLYFICMTPVSTGKYLRNNSVQLWIVSKSGKVLYRSQSLRGAKGQLAVNNGTCHVSVNGRYYRINNKGDVEFDDDLSQTETYPPIVVGEKVYFGSPSGTLDEFENGSLKKYFFAKNMIPPVYGLGSMYWFTLQGVYQMQESRIGKVLSARDKKFVHSLPYRNRICGITENGEVVALNNMNQVYARAITHRTETPFASVVSDKLVLQSTHSLHVLEF
jgi:hypothetical protein